MDIEHRRGIIFFMDCIHKTKICRKFLKNTEGENTWNVKTLKAVGRDLFDLQCEGRGEHRMHGDPV